MPEPVLVSMAAALAGRLVMGVYDLVKAKFADDPQASAVLVAAEGAAEDSARVRELAETLEAKQAADPEFARQLHAEWQRSAVAQQAETGGVTNQVSGNVSGKVLQARDIHGDITF
ncbi:hypothetical protein [Amycolatopsis sp. cmx-4-68]|uniref:hypothetical protein n=1 Tax=Amycolatopsis sp. cmx-4-68 TaxID=2790938 RepID=UPI00397C9DFC